MYDSKKKKRPVALPAAHIETSLQNTRCHGLSPVVQLWEPPPTPSCKICICFWPHYPNWAELMKGVNGKSNSRNPCLCWKLRQLDSKKGARPSFRNCPHRWWSPENAGGYPWTTWACAKHLTLFHTRALKIRETWIWRRNHLVDKHLLHEEGISSFSYMAMPWADLMWVWIPDHESLLMGSLELIENMLM